MSLKKIFNVLKNEGVLIPAIDKYLLSEGDDNDRGHGWNSPSGVSSCPLSQFYTRMHERRDGNVEPRARRIFDNGTCTHVRLQGYLLKSGKLIMDEVPVWDRKLFILGHTDGLIQLSKLSLAILEIKSINSNGFSKLIDAKDEHKEQAQVYMMSVEKLRKELHECKNEKAYQKKRLEILNAYEKLLWTFVVDGRKFTKEEKISHQVGVMGKTLDILWECSKPITDMIFLYENKDTQELKEYRVKWNDELVKEIEEKYKYINNAVNKKNAPPRPKEATGKSCTFCRWCNFKLKCWH